MCQYDLELDKYWVTKSGYSRIWATVAFCMGITNKKPLLFHDI